MGQSMASNGGGERQALTPLRLMNIIKRLGWSPTHFAREVGCTPKLVRRMLHLDPVAVPIPPVVARFALEMDRFNSRVPRPRDWKRR